MLKQAVQQGRRRVETGGVAPGYVEDFDEPRTKLAVCFSILLAVEGFAAVTEQIVIGSKSLISRLGRIDLDNMKFGLLPRGTMQNPTSWSDDLAITNKG